ncbi:replication endonuclease [Vibrio rhizosphaerae]|uniref:Replication endonuclease n=2 Tax=Vibrio rhizosphaerae TaxID=398736 RepID=A0ABU4ITI2_9VIBR|nr:replication endonuclease [Vibrio rhizosphaerae]MDW6092046.1 replication endonuclease [Vibrio rhizosphaerae]
MKYTASFIGHHINRTLRKKHLIDVYQVRPDSPYLSAALRLAEAKGDQHNAAEKDAAKRDTFENGTPFSRHFMPRLPKIVQEDIQHQIFRRRKRANPTRKNIELAVNDAVRHGLKFAPLIEKKFPFVDARKNAPAPPVTLGHQTVSLDHDTLMSDEQIERLAWNLTHEFTAIMGSVSIDEATEHGYLDALQTAFSAIRDKLFQLHIKPPQIRKHHDNIREAERELERAIRRCLDVGYLARKFRFLRTQYIEFSQIALDRVGASQGQRKYISRRSFARWRQKQGEAKRFIESMAVFDPETGTAFDLEEVVKRTTANQENRRVELVVRSRGDEERAIDLGYEGVFITWTLPSKYHRNSSKWNGCTPKEAHQNIMEQWKRARALFKKHEIDWFGLRVAEPHKDGTPHAHLFLYVHPSQKADFVRICESIACEEDRDELISGGLFHKSHRIKIEYSDPAKGTATGYIIKYISKNINGSHMPENDAEESAFSARAWASTHRIKQFSQSGSPAVGLWRQLRRASAVDTAFDEELETLRDHADQSRWKGFCELGAKAKLAYEENFNKYGDTVKRVIGVNWLGKIIQTCATRYSLVKKKDVQRLQEARRASPWSTENKCNPSSEKEISTLEKALIDATGWSVKGVQCLIAPLMRGAKIAIDRYVSLKLSNHRLITLTDR